MSTDERLAGILSAMKRKQLVPVLGRDLAAWPAQDGRLVTLDEQVARGLQALASDGAAPEGKLPQARFTEDVALHFRAPPESDPRNKARQLFERARSEAQPGPIPETLRRLAAMEELDLYLSVTFDDMIVRAIREERPGIQVVETSSWGGRAPQDLAELNEETGARPTVQVHYLFGTGHGFALFDDERIRAILSLRSKLDTMLVHLQERLRGCQLLFLGCGFPDWLMRFFLVAFGGEVAQRRVQVVDDELVRAPALGLFLQTMEVRAFGGDVGAFIQALSVARVREREERAPQPRVGAKILVSCHENDAPHVSAQAAKLRSWGLDVDVLLSTQNIDAVGKAIGACSFYVVCLSRSTLSAPSEEQRRMLTEWKLARELEKSREGFAARSAILSAEAEVIKAISIPGHPCAQMTKAAVGPNLAVQLAGPLFRAGHLRFAKRLGPDGKALPLRVYCIYGRADAPELEKRLRVVARTPWIELLLSGALPAGTKWEDVIAQADAFVLFLSPDLYEDTGSYNPLDQAGQAADRGGVPRYSVEYGALTVQGDELLAFNPLQISAGEALKQRADKDAAWKEVGDALREALLDFYLATGTLEAM